MWKCKECGEMNGDTSMYCASCGEARLVPRAQGAGQQAVADAGSSEQRKYIPCQEANALYRWAETLWRICRIAAVLLLVVPVISYRLNEANEMTLRLNFFFLVPAVGCLVGGYTVKLVLEALAVITESSFQQKNRQ